MDICRDCKQEKEIEDRGRCKECLLKYHKNRYRKYIEQYGRTLFDKICINCQTDFKVKNPNTKYCTVCSEFFHEKLGTTDLTIYKNRTSQIVNKIEFVIESEIPKGMVIHHIDFDKTNNSYSNLALLPNIDHIKFHSIVRHMNTIHKSCGIELDANFKKAYLKECSERFDVPVYVFDEIGNHDETYALTTIPLTYNIICAQCNKQFVSSNSEVKLCSTECSQLYRRKVKHPSKEELEKMVWDRPTSTLAKEFGVSDVAIAKWCKQNNVKKPPRGYWAKQQT